MTMWGAEEVGLVGSDYHVSQANHSTTEGERLSDYLVNLNYDMQNLPYNISELGGGSDYASFLTAGIVISGLNAGVSDVKTKEERDYYDQMFGQGKGGIAGVTYDHCYHDFCDSLANINPLVHYKLTQAAAYVLEYLGRHDDLRLYLYPQSEIQQLERLLLHKSTRKYNAQTEFYKKN
ncbi:unnamed protein product [Rotaria sp. Silwood1]|nr:unnamed protein product [Rotaria sp. Silwood1]